MTIAKDDYDRVTAVLFPYAQLHKIPQDRLAFARERGAKVDEVIDAWLGDIEIYDIPPEWSLYVQSAKLWLEKQKIFKGKERFYDDENLLTGECDCIRETANGLVIVDFKATAKEGATWPLQGAAYAYLASKQGLNIVGIEFVHLDKTGKEPKVYTYDIEKNWAAFADCLKCYRMFFKNKKPEDLDYL